jgi:hypothetical protein
MHHFAVQSRAITWALIAVLCTCWLYLASPYLWGVAWGFAALPYSMTNPFAFAFAVGGILMLAPFALVAAILVRTYRRKR